MKYLGDLVKSQRPEKLFRDDYPLMFFFPLCFRGRQDNTKKNEEYWNNEKKRENKGL